MKPTDRQENYAKILVEQLQEGGHWKASMFAKAILICEDKARMSTLIGRMIKAVKEMKDADATVEQSHRGPT
jgi:hypothetical protein